MSRLTIFVFTLFSAWPATGLAAEAKSFDELFKVMFPDMKKCTDLTVEKMGGLTENMDINEIGALCHQHGSETMALAGEFYKQLKGQTKLTDIVAAMNTVGTVAVRCAIPKVTLNVK